MAPKPGKHHKSARTRDGGKEEGEPNVRLDACPLSFPSLLTIDNEHSLPKYTAVVSRPDGSLSMDDVDRVQLELEALLSASAQRRKLLCAELKSIGSMEKKRGRPPGSSPGSPGKGSRNIERPPKKFKDCHGRSRETATASASASGSTPVKPVKPRPSTSTAYNAEDILPQIQADPAAVSPIIKNNIPEKFWASMEQYCGVITTKDVSLLERLRDDQEMVEDYLSVPELGRHYTLVWAEQELESEDDSTVKVSVKTEESSDLGTLTQRLVSGLVEENSSNSIDAVADESYKETDSVLPRPGLVGQSASPPLNGASQLEVRLKRELQNQGFLDDEEQVEGAAVSFPVEHDQVSAELELCQKQLRTVSTHNMAQLDRLLQLAKNQLRRQELKQELDVVDAQVQEAYQAIASARQKKRSPTKKEREVAWKALKDRDEIIKQLDAC